VLWWSPEQIAAGGKPFFDPEAQLDDHMVKKKVKGEWKDVIIEGYRGKAKELKQILLERGLWKEGMVSHVDKEKDEAVMRT